MEVIIKQKQAEIDDYITQENYSSMCEIVVFFCYHCVCRWEYRYANYVGNTTCKWCKSALED